MGRYLCQGRQSQTEGTTCISFGAADVDEAIAAAVLRAVQPLGVEAALHAIEERGKEASERARLAELALEEARFHADQARARFEAVDPRNRNVIGNLSRTWEERLEVVWEREGQLAAARSQLQDQKPTSAERAAYLALGAELERVNGVTLDFSRPRKSTDNAFIESINGLIRAECLNASWFLSLEDARSRCET